MAEKFHADTATLRAKERKVVHTVDSFKPESLKKYGGTTKSGAPMRSIKESLVNRGPGERAAQSYLSPKARQPVQGSILETRTSIRPSGGNRRAGEAAVGAQRSGPRSFSATERARLGHVSARARYDVSPTAVGRSAKQITSMTTSNPAGRMSAGKYLQNQAARKFAKGTVGGELKAIAKSVGRVGGKVASRLAGPVGMALTAYDVYDTAKTVKETVGAVRELGKVRAAGREAEAGASAIRSAMNAKYPLAGAIQAPPVKKGEVTKIGIGQRKDRQSVIRGIKIN